MRVLLLALSLCLFGLLVTAFKPDEPGHVGITEQSLASLGFCRHARDAVEDANVLTDIFEQLVSEAHFDDETLRAGSQRLLAKRDRIVRLIRESVDEQDKRARGIFDDIDDILDDIDDAASDFLEDAINAGYDAGIGFLEFVNPKQSRAWTALGQALHSLQDFYSHSNWVEMGSTDINRQLGEEELDNPSSSSQPCRNDPAVLDLSGDGGSVLTTSYFLFDPTAHCELEDFPGKCRHGWDLAGCASGLNKDEATRPGNAEAKAFAIDATTAFVDSILQELRDIGSEYRDEFLGGDDCSVVPTNTTAIFRREAALAGPDSCDTMQIEVDQIGSDYSVLVTLKDYTDITLTNPNGVEVDDDDYSIEDSDDDQREFTLEDPISGSFTLEVCGSDDLDYEVVVTTESNLFPFRFFFTRLAGTRNEGVFPQTNNQQPLLNVANGVSAELYGSDISVSSVSFALVSLDGTTVLQTFTLANTEMSFDGIIFSGDLTINTAEEFRVRVTGETTNGDSFVRLFSTKTFQAQTVEVQYVGELTSFQLGRDQDEVSFVFSVANRANTQQTLDLALSVQGELESAFSGSIVVSQARAVTTSSVTLQAGETADVTATLIVDDHDDLDVGDVIQVSLTASSSATSNAVDVVGQYVACRGNPVCNGQGVCSSSTEACICFFGVSGETCSNGNPNSASGSSASPNSVSPNTVSNSVSPNTVTNSVSPYSVSPNTVSRNSASPNSGSSSSSSSSSSGSTSVSANSDSRSLVSGGRSRQDNDSSTAATLVPSALLLAAMFFAFRD